MTDGINVSLGALPAKPNDFSSLVPLDPVDAQYLTQLNIEVIYAQKAYAMALAHMRKRYNTPDSEWALNNIDMGFERVVNGKA